MYPSPNQPQRFHPAAKKHNGNDITMFRPSLDYHQSVPKPEKPYGLSDPLVDQSTHPICNASYPPNSLSISPSIPSSRTASTQCLSPHLSAHPNSIRSNLNRQHSLVRPERARPRTEAERRRLKSLAHGSMGSEGFDDSRDGVRIGTGNDGGAGGGSEERDRRRALFVRNELGRGRSTILADGTAERRNCPGWWFITSRVLTFWAFNPMLRAFGLRDKAMQQAWREKVSLVTIIILLCTAVGFLTFGFNVTICGRELFRIRAKGVSLSQVVILGRAYQLASFRHPVPAKGVASDGDLLASPARVGGKDLTFMFQNVNHNCKGLLVPDNANEQVINYFPCKVIEPWWSNVSPTDNPKNVGCHTSEAAKQAVARLKFMGDVYYDWEDLRKNGTSLVVYNGNVLDLSRLKLLVPSIHLPPSLADFANPNSPHMGHDATYSFSATPDRVRMARCMTEILKVGVVDYRSPGCIISDIVLWISLFVIIGVVLIRFLLAVLFGWFLSWRLGSIREETTEERRAREEEVMQWEMRNNENLHYPKSKSIESRPISGGSSRIPTPSTPTNSYPRPTSKFQFLPTTSRFTQRGPGGSGLSTRPFNIDRSRQLCPLVSPNDIPLASLPLSSMGMNGRSEPSSPKLSPISLEGSVALGALENRTMQMSQHMSANSSNTYFQLPDTDRQSVRSASRSSHSHSLPSIRSQLLNDSSASPSSPSSISISGQKLHNLNFNLIHTIMLVTCYSEGAEGLRTTLDSLADTSYPATHKLLLVICDGIITGSGNVASTPDIVLSMMTNFLVPKDQVRPASYMAIANGQKRHNMVKIYAGFYKYSDEIPQGQRQRVPMITIVKCGTPAEEEEKKAGNRGKRDSQVILMSFMQKFYYGDRMCEMDYEFCKAIYRLTGVHPTKFEIVLMVDADTKVFPDSLTRMIAVMSRDHLIMGLCGETRIANKADSWVTMIQVFEYYISHHMSKAFESIFGGVTCLPGCFCMYRIIAPKGNRFFPVLCSSDIVEMYSENVVDTLHKKNLLLLGEDRYLTTLMLRTFPKRKMMFVPQAVCKTVVPDTFHVLLSQRRRWINSTVHNLLELVLIRDLCGTFCFSMQFVVFMELVGTVVLPAAISFTLYLVVISFFVRPVPIIPLLLLAAILGLPAVLISLTTRKMVYVGWMFVYLLSLPIWNFVLPVYAYWHFDDFSWGQTRLVQGEVKGDDHSRKEGEFDSSQIVMRRFEEWARGGEGEEERDRERMRRNAIAAAGNVSSRGDLGGRGGYGVPGKSAAERYNEDRVVWAKGISRANSVASVQGDVGVEERNGSGWSTKFVRAQQPERATPMALASRISEGNGLMVADIKEGKPTRLPNVYMRIAPSLPALDFASAGGVQTEIEMDEIVKGWKEGVGSRGRVEIGHEESWYR
ncbi:chitin synthase-domain-containing protein [Endogone sp. FLAS-F59071]|nr:chitin synthase-domain-containing protein [Endogone sp. FLAS-F59071]|eukprot:RUS18327.1 chitin synthase-domain-containing protein [Endogone sp. FLAS-F59071]